MADNLLFEKGDGDDHLLSALTWDELGGAYGPKIRWDESANLKFSYLPVPVFVHAISATSVTFSIVDCNRHNKGALDEKFTIALQDFNLCHEGLPSTSRNALKIGNSPMTERRIVFLMINYDKAKALKSHGRDTVREFAVVANAMSLPLTGKWPQTAEAIIADIRAAADARVAEAYATAKEWAAKARNAAQEREIYATIINHVARATDAGHVVTAEDLKRIRSAEGIPPNGPL